MKTFLTLALAAALCAPAVAQQSGMINRNAPAVKQTITIGDAKMSLDYTSLNYGEGKEVGKLMDKANADARKKLNEGAPKKPLAKFSTNVDVKVGDATLTAGDYDVFFTVNDDTTMNINFRMGEKVTTSKLVLSPEAGHQHQMLVMSLYAGDNGGAGVYLGFGKMSGMLTIAPAGKAATTGK